MRLARESDRPASDVALDLCVHPTSLRKWMLQEKADNGTRSDRQTTTDRLQESVLFPLSSNAINMYSIGVADPPKAATSHDANDPSTTSCVSVRPA